MLKLLYEQTGHPIFQNRIYDLAQESKDCLKVDIRLVEDGVTGLVYNAAFLSRFDELRWQLPELAGLSSYFRRHLDAVADIVDRHLARQAKLKRLERGWLQLGKKG